MRPSMIAAWLLVAPALVQPLTPAVAQADSDRPGGGSGEALCLASTSATVCIEVEQEGDQTRARVTLEPIEDGFRLAPRKLTWLRGTETRDPDFCASGCGLSQEPWTSPWYDAPSDGRFAARLTYVERHNGRSVVHHIAAGRSDRVLLADNCRTIDAGQVCAQLLGRHAGQRLVLTNIATVTPADGSWIRLRAQANRSRRPGEVSSVGGSLCEQNGGCPRLTEPTESTFRSRLRSAGWRSHTAVVMVRGQGETHPQKVEATYTVPQ